MMWKLLEFMMWKLLEFMMWKLLELMLEHCFCFLAKCIILVFVCVLTIGIKIATYSGP